MVDQKKPEKVQRTISGLVFQSVETGVFCSDLNISVVLTNNFISYLDKAGMQIKQLKFFN